MEHSSEENAENETPTGAELRRNDCNIRTDSTESEGSRLVASTTLCASTSSDRHGSSTLTNSKTINDFDLNERLESRSGDADLLYEDKRLSSREDLRRTSGSLNNVDSGITSEGRSNIISDRPLGCSYSKPLYSSNFSNFFFQQAQKGVWDKNHEKSIESQIMPVNQNKDSDKPTRLVKEMQGYLSEEASDSLMKRNSICSDVIREGSELSHCGINLREWLHSKGSDASKNEKIRLFRQIVLIVDDAHSQGIALLELWPSSFILLETGNVKYIGSQVEVELLSSNWDITKKRGLEHEISTLDNSGLKMQKMDDDKPVRYESRVVSKFVNAQNFLIYEGTSNQKFWPTSDNAQLEKKWYASSEGFETSDLLPYNIYCLGLLLFEFLFQFESIEALSAAMLDLRHLILPPSFLSENPKEAGFCFWLLHPNPSSRPSTREILQSELIYGSGSTGLGSTGLRNDESLEVDMVADAESDLLLDFLVLLKQHVQNKASNLSETIKLLDADVKMIERTNSSRKNSDTKGGVYHKSIEIPHSSISKTNALRNKLLGNISQLEDAYFFARSQTRLTEIPNIDRSDKDVLNKRDNWSCIETQHNLPTAEEKSSDRIGAFFNGICKFGRYSKFEVCGILRNGDILNSNNVVCSLSFDREEEYIAAAGVSMKIKIFEVASLLDENVDVQYPVLEISNKSKFSCICWNNYIKNYLASTDYDGIVKMWDASTGQRFAEYKEHQRRAWSVDFSQVDPTKFASGSDDCSVRLWNINEKNSIGTIWNPANICCVQFSAYSSHLLSFGSADYRIYCYDLRHTKIPWCTLAGHENAVSYVKFLDAETLVSASTDNTLKLWDLKKTSLEGLSPNACSMTFSGHTNEKNFVGLSVLDGYIACGSETNEVYAYYKSLPMPIMSHKFGSIDPISGYESSDSNGQFVSSVCWSRKSQMIVAANSSGNMKVLRMV